jgi:uncharacterized RDD family membrane protein YckC
MGARFGGLVLDTLVLAVPTLLLAIPLGAFRRHTSCDEFGTCTRSLHVGTNLLVDLMALAIGIAYSAYFVGMRTQTLGQRAAGIRVVDAQTGAPVGPGRGALRWLVMSITGAICTLGYWSPFFDSYRRQGWHDKAASSVVIPARPPG